MFCLLDLLNIFSSLWWTKGLERAPWKFKPLSDLSFIRRTRVDSWIPIRFRVLSVYTFSGTERFWSIIKRNHFDFDSQQSLTDMYFVTPVFCEERNVKRQTITICTRYHKRSLVWWHWISSLSSEYAFVLWCSCQNTLLHLPECFFGNCHVCGIVFWQILHSSKTLDRDAFDAPPRRSLSDSNSSFKFLRLEVYSDDNGKRSPLLKSDGGSTRFLHTQLFNNQASFLGQDICLNRPYIGFVWLKGNPQYKRTWRLPKIME